MTCPQILWSLITRTFGIFSRHIVITKFQFFSGHFVYFHRWSMLEITLWNMTIGTVAWLSKHNLGWIRTNCMGDGGRGGEGRNGCFCSLRMWKDLTKIWLTSLKLCVSSGLCGSRFPIFSSHTNPYIRTLSNKADGHISSLGYMFYLPQLHYSAPYILSSLPVLLLLAGS